MQTDYAGTAVAEADALTDPGFKASLWRWRWILGYLFIAWGLAAQIPSYLPMAPAESLGGQPIAWALSPGISANLDGDKLFWEAQRPGEHWASRALAVPDAAEFVRVSFCLAGDAPPDTAAVLLASVREGRLDFNRQYRVNSFYSGLAGECFDEPIPRRTGDGPAVLQIQLLSAPAALSLSALEVGALRENPVWRLSRMAMLVLGVVLLALLFKDYRHARPRLLAGAGLITVLGILFGCCVSVSLKADIYALLTGGRSIDAKVSMQALLQTQFPLGGFSIFTFLHAVLFCGATFFLGLARRHAWWDMVMLAPMTETMQLFVPGRGPGTRDMLVDWCGVALALLLVVLLRRSQRVRTFLKY
ncbi:VanZ family protein [Congregibacter variabilis]|uniref:VanZ family protein n=1 Tax=Congregibacter variabilis TaxID=3081200 RepID=A0ABZ0I4I9_9GAMM|nr:VanZ family protein [Congregibacter sp. IMCC43200]